jgi:hypothetical protein
MRDRNVDRGQCSRAQYGARDDDAGRGLLVDDEVGAHAEHGRLQHHAHYFREGAKPAGSVAGVAVARKIVGVDLGPAPHEMRQHSHGYQRLGIALRRLDHGVASLGELRRHPGRPEHEPFGDEREDDQNECADGGRHADPEVEGKADAEIDRHPRQVEKRNGTDTAEKGAHRIEVPHRCRAVVAHPDHCREPHNGVIDPRAERLIEADADAGEDAAADEVEQPERDIEPAREHCEPDESGHAAARQHAVVHLEHKEWARQN